MGLWVCGFSVFVGLCVCTLVYLYLFVCTTCKRLDVMFTCICSYLCLAACMYISLRTLTRRSARSADVLIGNISV